ncbi:endonuclease/exonuclease/phosphatase family protein [Providencia sp.]|uniref:endonuclease/exonuclease/phosphatase family protein n=1 Tax=Providencia sp. TaxID=589 RepID=UPI0033425C4B
MNRINLAWWNIGISPPIHRTLKDKTNELIAVKTFLTDLFVDKSIDFFVFCEVSSNNTDFLSDLAQELSLDFVDLTSKNGRLILDMSVMYESSKLEYITHKSINEDDASGVGIRAGVKVIFKELKTEKFITFFLSHWNSKLSIDEMDRNDFSNILRKMIDRVFDTYGIDSHVILLGDYNTQPYAQALHENLKTTKDYLLIKEKPKKERMLFNPFWKCISDNKYHSTGSYYHEYGRYDRWFAFDQMMFSSSFIIDNDEKYPLRLDLSSFKYHSLFDCDTMVMDSDFLAIFDHVPIFGRIYYDKC